MKRYWLALLLVAFAAFPLLAQTRKTYSPSPSTTTAPKPAATAQPTGWSTQTPTDIFSANLGLAIPVGGDISDIAETGFQFGGDWVHMGGRDVGFGIDSDFAYYGQKSKDGEDLNLHQFSLHGIVRSNLSSSGSAAPYLMGGFGVTMSSLQISFGSGEATESDTSPSFLLGAGIDLPTANGMTIGLSGRYTHYFYQLGDKKGGGALQLLAALRW